MCGRSNVAFAVTVPDKAFGFWQDGSEVENNDGGGDGDSSFGGGGGGGGGDNKNDDDDGDGDDCDTVRGGLRSTRLHHNTTRR